MTWVLLDFAAVSLGQLLTGPDLPEMQIVRREPPSELFGRQTIFQISPASLVLNVLSLSLFLF